MGIDMRFCDVCLKSAEVQESLDSVKISCDGEGDFFLNFSYDMCMSCAKQLRKESMSLCSHYVLAKQKNC